MASPLDYDPKFSHYWSEHLRDKVFGANTNTFSSRFPGFSICHPVYHENTRLLATAIYWRRHAIYSAAVSTEETVKFMLLPSWNKDMTTKSLCISLPQIPTHVYIPLHHPIKPTPICKRALLEQHTNTTFQTLLGIADHCHMEHQGQGLPQCSQQRLAKRTCQRKTRGKVGNLKHT